MRWHAGNSAPGSLPLTSLEAGVSDVFERQRGLGTELAEVRAQISEFAASTSQLTAAINKLESTALTFGDIQGYLAAIEHETAVLQAALQNIQARPR